MIRHCLWLWVCHIAWILLPSLQISASCSFGVGHEAGAANFTNCLALIWPLHAVALRFPLRKSVKRGSTKWGPNELQQHLLQGCGAEISSTFWKQDHDVWRPASKWIAPSGGSGKHAWQEILNWFWTSWGLVRIGASMRPQNQCCCSTELSIFGASGLAEKNASACLKVVLQTRVFLAALILQNRIVEGICPIC